MEAAFALLLPGIVSGQTFRGHRGQMTYADMAVTFLGAHWLGGLIWLAFGATALGLGVTIAQLHATQRRGHC